MKFKKDLDGWGISYEQEALLIISITLLCKLMLRTYVNDSANSIKGKLVVRLGYFVFSINQCGQEW